MGLRSQVRKTIYRRVSLITLIFYIYTELLPVLAAVSISLSVTPAAAAEYQSLYSLVQINVNSCLKSPCDGFIKYVTYVVGNDVLSGTVPASGTKTFNLMLLSSAGTTPTGDFRFFIPPGTLNVSVSISSDEYSDLNYRFNDHEGNSTARYHLWEADDLGFYRGDSGWVYVEKLNTVSLRKVAVHLDVDLAAFVDWYNNSNIQWDANGDPVSWSNNNTSSQDYPSIYDYGQPVSYCSSTACSGSSGCEVNAYPCSGPYPYKYTNILTGFDALYNLNDPKILCEKDLPDVSWCGPVEEKTLSFSIGTLVQPGLYHIDSFPDTFKFFVPPGTVYGYANIYMPSNAVEGFVVRYQRPPDYQGQYAGVSSWDIPSQVSLNTMKQRDVFIKNRDGLAAAISPFSLSSPLSQSNAGWFYVRQLPSTSSTIHKLSISFRVNVAAYMAWYGITGGYPPPGDDTPPPGEGCSQANLSACSNPTDCSSVGGYWYNNTCNYIQDSGEVTSHDFVGYATAGQGLGKSLLFGAAHMPTMHKTNPTANSHTDPGNLYVQEVIPGYDETMASEENRLQAAYERPDKLRQYTTEQRTGFMGQSPPNQYSLCRETHLIHRDTQSVYSLTFEREYPDGHTESYDYQGTVRFGSNGLNVPTLGVVRQKKILFETLSDGSKIWGYQNFSPFTKPQTDGNWISWNFQITGSSGEIGVVNSYGTSNDGFMVGGYIYLNGSNSLNINADLYEITRKFSFSPNDDGSCPPDVDLTASPCSFEGVEWCNAPTNILPDLLTAPYNNQQSTSQHTSAYNAYQLAVNVNQNTPPNLQNDQQILDTVNMNSAINRGVDPMAASVFGGCVVQGTINEGSISAHIKEINTCTGIYDHIPGCEFTRKLHFTKSTVKTIMTVTQQCAVYSQPPSDPPPDDWEPTILRWEACELSPLPDLSTVQTMGSPDHYEVTISEGVKQIYNYTPYSPSPTTFTYDPVPLIHYGQYSATREATLYYITENNIDGCYDYYQRSLDGWCDPPNIECTNYSSTRYLDGVTYSAGDNIAAKIESWDGTIDPMCNAGIGHPVACNYTIGQADCFTNTQGEEVCPEVTDIDNFISHPDIFDGLDDCESQGLYNNDACKKIGIECAEGSRGDVSGFCYVASIVYDCGEDREISVPGLSGNVHLCQGAIRCLGTECHNPAGETSSDFAQVAASAEAIEMMQSDTTCAETGEAPTLADQDSCTPVVFDGEHLTCKIPIGHSIGLTDNCCREGMHAAAGVSAINYLKVAVYTNRLARNSAVAGALAKIPGTSSFTNVFNSAENLYQSGVAATRKMLVTPFANFAEHMGWQTTSEATEEIAKGGATTFVKKAVMQKTYDFIADRLGMEELADSIFEQYGGVVEGLSSNIATCLSVIGAAWTAYNIMKILMHMIFACGEEDMQLGIQRKTGNCTYVGTYCAKKVLHTCVEKKESYCCYKSPLSRIIMEQVRPQLGGFGSKKHPNCGGVSPQELESVNWDAVDLSEWTVRLSDAGLLPTTADELDQMWNPENTSKFELAYGSDQIPGPDGKIDKAQELSDRNYDPDRVTGIRNTLADSATCYSDFDYQPWYGNEEVEPADVIKEVGGVGHIGTCGEGCIDIYIGSTVRNSLGPDECTHIYEQPYTIEVLRPDLIESATVEGLAWNDHIELLINGRLIYRGPNANVFPPELPGTCQLGTDWCMGDSGSAYCSSTIPYPSPFDVTSDFAVQGQVQTMTRVAVGGTGLGYARIQVHYNPNKDTSAIDSGCFEPIH